MLQKGFSVVSIIFIVVILIAVFAVGVYVLVPMITNSYKNDRSKIQQSYTQNKKSPDSQVLNSDLSDPASEYCIKVGGDLKAQTRSDGGEYSLCNFANDQSCEELALYRRDCPIGGVKTAGFNTPEQIYCVQLGGKTAASENAKCTLPNGKVCSNSDLYSGKCQIN